MSDGMSEAFGSTNRLQREASKKYIVFYVLNNKPKVKKFATKQAALKFSKSIEYREDFNTWVDYIVKGTIIKEDK